MQVNIPKHSIATHPIRKTIDGVSKYTPIFVKLNLEDDGEKQIASTLEGLIGSTDENQFHVYDNQSLCYSFIGAIKEIRERDGVVVLEVAEGVSVQYPPAQ